MLGPYFLTLNIHYGLNNYPDIINSKHFRVENELAREIFKSRY